MKIDIKPEILFLEQWNRIKEKLLKEYGEDVYSSWIKPLSLVSHSGSNVVISAPNAFMRDWIIDNYSNKIIYLFKKENNNVNKLDIIVYNKMFSIIIFF